MLHHTFKKELTNEQIARVANSVRKNLLLPTVVDGVTISIDTENLTPVGVKNLKNFLQEVEHTF